MYVLVCKPCALHYVGYSTKAVKERIRGHKAEFKKLCNLDNRDDAWRSGCEFAKHCSKAHPEWNNNGDISLWMQNVSYQLVWALQNGNLLGSEEQKELCMKAEAFWQAKTGSLLFGLNRRVERNSAWYSNKAVDSHIV